MLAEFTTWLLSLVVKAFAAFFGLLSDVLIAAVDGILSAVVGLLGLIPVPDSMAMGIQGFFSQLDPSIMYFVVQLQLPAVFAMFGAAYSFRLVRKVVTLFQW
jgi:hypothetical protein